MAFGKKSSFNKISLILGLLLLAVVAAESLLTAPITGITVVIWILILLPVIISAFSLPKMVYAGLAALALVWLLIEVIFSVGSQIGIYNGLKILFLALFAVSMIPSYLGARK